jgi:hypothetical protein
LSMLVLFPQVSETPPMVPPTAMRLIILILDYYWSCW